MSQLGVIPRNMHWAMFAAALFLQLLCPGPTFAAAPGQQPTSAIIGMKALFDEDFLWITKAGADKLVADAKAAGFTAIIPCVWHARGTSWKSDLAPIDKKLASANIGVNDPLGYLIKIAHQNGLKVYPWFTVFKRELDIMPQFADPSVDKFFNPHDPKFIAFISDLVQEVVRKYETDGVNLDYVRSTGLCNSASCIADYHSKTGRDLVMDSKVTAVSPAASQSIINWRTGAITNGVREISRKVRATRPNQMISVDTIANDPEWRSFGADSITWAQEGIIDVILHMDYRKTLLKKFLQDTTKKVAEPERFVTIISNVDLPPDKIVSRSTSTVESLLNQVAEISPQNSAYGFYEYRFLTPGHIEALRRFNNSPPKAPSGITTTPI